MRNDSARIHVAVVGGGVMGCATAYLLARAGMDVTLVERDAVAAHASGCNAGNLNPLHRTPAEAVPFALAAFALHQEIAAELGTLGCAHYALQPAQRIHLAYSESERRELEEVASLFASTPGFSSAWLDRDDLVRVEPRLAQEIRYGVLAVGNLSVDSSQLTRSLAEGAVRLGASILHENVLGTVSAGARVTGIKTRERIVHCDAVVFATGPWVADMNLWLGIDVGVKPIKGDLLLMRLPDGSPSHDLHCGSVALYRRQRDLVWVGGTADACGFDAAPSAEARQRLTDAAARIMPAMKHADLRSHVAALRPMPASKLPIAEKAVGWENAYLANGGGMKGVLFSVGVARVIHDLLQGASSDSAATSVFANTREHCAAALS